jgi:uncharacterized membrane protein
LFRWQLHRLIEKARRKRAFSIEQESSRQERVDNSKTLLRAVTFDTATVSSPAVY